MYRYIAYLKFLITSTNQHGVHSPFVYHFITKGLYQQKKSTTKTMDVLLKSLDFLNVRSLKITPDSIKVRTLVQEFYPAIHILENDGDLQYYTNLNAMDAIDFVLKDIHNDSIILIGDIHKNSQSTHSWEQLRRHSKITVSMDLYYCGILFFRKEQVKEHFKIRI